MGVVELFLVAVGLSMDAFAVSVSLGLSLPRCTSGKAMTAGLYFGVFQAAMPLLGFLAATFFAESIISYDHWIAFVLLSFLGGRMMAGSFVKEGCADRACPEGLCEDRACPGGKKPDIRETSLRPSEMLPFALATSIDALAVGVSFAFLRVSIVPAVSFIGITTLAFSFAGVKIGNVFGAKYKSHAELLGGAILVLIGLKILLEHLFS
jgi:putative Mn2+ efflux pump MntP